MATQDMNDVTSYRLVKAEIKVALTEKDEVYNLDSELFRAFVTVYVDYLDLGIDLTEQIVVVLELNGKKYILHSKDLEKAVEEERRSRKL